MNIQPDDINRILSNDRVITPSPAFVNSVMQAVEEDVSAREPRAFPWSRLAPGYVVVLFTVIIGMWSSRDSFSVSSDVTGLVASFAMSSGLVWLLLAAAMTFFALMIPTLLIRGRSYV